MSKVLYPGSFNPMTKGHMNIIEQATNLFDEIVIAIMTNSIKKEALFSVEERLLMIKDTYKGNSKVSVVIGEGATVDIANQYNCQAIIRGIRNTTDFDYEFQLACINKDISSNHITTIALFPDLKYQYISSTMIRELFNLGKTTEAYVHPIIEQELQKKKEKRR